MVPLLASLSLCLLTKVQRTLEEAVTSAERKLDEVSLNSKTVVILKNFHKRPYFRSLGLPCLISAGALFSVSYKLTKFLTLYRHLCF